MDDPIRIEPKGKRGGEWITFGEEQYRVPALSFRALQELQERISGLAGLGAAGMPTQEQMSAVVDVVHAAMVRNYPDITVDTVSDLVDIENCSDVLGAVLKIAGYRARGAGEASGEARASTGTSSTQP